MAGEKDHQGRPVGFGLSAWTLQYHPHRPQALEHHDEAVVVGWEVADWADKELQSEAIKHEVLEELAGVEEPKKQEEAREEEVKEEKASTGLVEQRWE